MWMNEKTNQPPGTSLRFLARTNIEIRQQFTAEKRARLPVRDRTSWFDTIDQRRSRHADARLDPR